MGVGGDSEGYSWKFPHQNVVKPMIDEIKAHIPDKLVKIFETLSAVRRFNARLLDQFIEDGLIEWSQNNGHELEDYLLETYLVSKKDGFLYDDLTESVLIKQPPGYVA